MSKRKEARDINAELWSRIKGRVGKAGGVIMRGLGEVPTAVTMAGMEAVDVAKWVGKGTKENFQRAKGWFQRQFEAAKSSAAVKLGKNKKEQLVNLAKTVRNLTVNRFREVRNGMVNRIEGTINSAGERIGDAKTRERLQHLQEELHQINVILERVKVLKDRKKQIERVLGLYNA